MYFLIAVIAINGCVTTYSFFRLRKQDRDISSILNMVVDLVESHTKHELSLLNQIKALNLLLGEVQKLKGAYGTSAKVN